MSGGGGSGLFHWVAELDSEENGPSFKLTELLFNHLGSLPEKQIAEIIWKGDKSDAKPIHWACQSGALHLLQKFLHEKVTEIASKLNETEENDEKEDSMETENNNFDPINCVDEKNETPLYWACLAGKIQVKIHQFIIQNIKKLILFILYSVFHFFYQKVLIYIFKVQNLDLLLFMLLLPININKLLDY